MAFMFVSFFISKGSSEGVSRSCCIWLHFAFHILVAWCSSFMVMRFPLRVVAITGVEAGYGNREGGMCLVLFVLLSSFLPLHITSGHCFCCHFRRRNIKNSRERKLAGLKNIDQCLCDRNTVRLLQQADLGIGHGIHGGIAHERWAEKASRTSLVVVLFSFIGRLAQASLRAALLLRY